MNRYDAFHSFIRDELYPQAYRSCGFMHNIQSSTVSELLSTRKAKPVINWGKFSREFKIKKESVRMKLLYPERITG